MKSTGIVRNIDELGRVVIPIEMRHKLDINEKDPMEIYSDGDLIILKKFQPNCVFCNNTKDLSKYKGKLICKKCVKKLSKNVENDLT